VFSGGIAGRISAALVLVALAPALQGCPEPVLIHDYCLIADTIEASDSDTQQTLKQVDRENGKHDCLCEGICPRGGFPFLTAPPAPEPAP
jgi:hypothetical protein